MLEYRQRLPEATMPYLYLSSNEGKGYEPALDSGTVTVHIRRLRTKVEDDPTRPRHLQTVWGVGYRLAP